MEATFVLVTYHKRLRDVRFIFELYYPSSKCQDLTDASQLDPAELKRQREALRRRIDNPAGWMYVHVSALYDLSYIDVKNIIYIYKLDLLLPGLKPGVVEKYAAAQKGSAAEKPTP